MKLSLAGWSLHRLFRAANNPLKLVDFPALAAERFGIDAVELNSPFFPSRDARFVRQLASAAERARVRLLNIAVDEVGDMSADSDAERNRAVMNNGRWVSVAAEVGCVAIRANTGGMGIIDTDKALLACVDSFRRLTDLGVKYGVTILIENHGGLSANADHLIFLIEEVRLTHGVNAIASLPDFGNFSETTDRYAQLAKILPYARAVHAKVDEIDADLSHPKFDLSRCVQLTRDSGYNGYLGIEYEGSGDPLEGVRRAIAKLSPML
jgi:sugar phosphate isomerase/epimerase